MAQKQGLWAMTKYIFRNAKAFKMYPMRDQSRQQLTLVNRKLASLPRDTALYRRRLYEYNTAMIRHYQGKWYATQALRDRSQPQHWKRASACFREARALAKALHQKLDTGDETDIKLPAIPLHQSTPETTEAQGVPLVPDITPVVLLHGSSEQMGIQYAQQLVEIFGAWILEQHTNNAFGTEEIEEMERWEEVHREHTPEMLDFCRGWSAGAQALGIPMTYHDVLDLWVGHRPPATTYLSSGDGLPELPPLACTSLAAWGRATPDGKLVAAATGDHDMSYQVTILAYPDEGIPFVFTTFGATGLLPTVGPHWFFGHPGMNRAGLTYVHHGGGPKMLEPPESWGYGIRRGPSVMHMLRYHRTAREARERECQWPIGDIGRGDQATVGGFYADDTYGYIIEGRQDPVAIREAGLLDEVDYLFANNSTAHPDAVKSPWMARIKDDWRWDKEGGWRPKQPTGMTKSLGMMLKWFSGRLSADELMSRGMMFAYWNSYQRNCFLHEMARTYHGRLTPETLKAIYRTTGTIPDAPWDKATAAYKKSGIWGKSSAAHASNALVVVMKPSEGLYSLCTGPALRGAAPISPSLAISIYNERNAFWDLRLGDTPDQTLEAARTLADALTQEAHNAAAHAQCSAPLRETLDALLSSIAQEHALLEQQPADDATIFSQARSLRAYTRIHVKARQLLNTLQPPPHAS